MNFGNHHSPFNFNFTLNIVRNNKIKGFYITNEKLFVKEDLKGNQHESLGLFYFLERMLFNIHDDSSVKIYDKIFNWLNDNKRGIKKNMISILKSGNFNSFSEFDLYARMYRNTYSKAIIFKLNHENYLLKFLKSRKSEDLMNMKYFSKFYYEFDQYCYLNTDFITKDLAGVLLNYKLIKFEFGLNLLIQNAVQNQGNLEKDLDLIQELQDLLDSDLKTFEKDYFKIIRRNMKLKDLENELEQNHLRISDRFLTSPELKQLINNSKILFLILQIVSTEKELDESLLTNQLENELNFITFNSLSILSLSRNLQFYYKLYYILRNLKQIKISPSFMNKLKDKFNSIKKYFLEFKFSTEVIQNNQIVKKVFDDKDLEAFYINNYSKKYQAELLTISKDNFISIKTYLQKFNLNN